MFRTLLRSLAFPPRILPCQLRMSSTARCANEHVSFDAEGNQVIDLTFASEARGMPAAEGYGWAQFEFGEQIGRDKRYTITRKLGWGMHSSTWLARDGDKDNAFVAIKALTGHITEMYDRAVVWEADAPRLLSYPPLSPHCTPLLDEFTIPGKGSAGKHMCFVLPLYGGDVKALVQSRNTPFPLPVAKRITLHLLRGIVHMHGRDVVHTDLKHDNIFYETTMTTAQIDAWLEKDPSRRHPPETSHDGIIQAAVSQPLPVISEEEALKATYVLADYGHW
jgi:serine/threonine protein kinase